MTPEEKAKELVDKFKPLVTLWDCYNDVPVPDEDLKKDAKKCAIICCDEIINSYDKNKEVGSSLIPVYNFWQ